MSNISHNYRSFLSGEEEKDWVAASLWQGLGLRWVVSTGGQWRGYARQRGECTKCTEVSQYCMGSGWESW